LDKLKEGMDDKNEQLAILSTFVRLGIVVWSGFCLTLAYIDLPGFPKQTFDPTFIASVFTSTLTTFGVQAVKNKGGDGITKKDMEKMLASQAGGYQVIRVETPLKIEGAQVVKVPNQTTINKE
tara:strand:- start:170 stop:538 length:369 start_codon:yes stop_codon:yes gene_type:complete